MKISRKWLQDFVYLPESLSSVDLADRLTLHTFEVEAVTPTDALLDKVVVGHVMSVQKHPNADSLQVCIVDVGGRMVEIVCGGSNVAEKMLVAVAQIGAKVQWHGEGEPIELKKTKIRGVESMGMICAAEEIGLGTLFPKKSEKEILDLTHLTTDAPGTPLVEALELADDVIDVDNKSMTHRPDLWGHYGIAREIAAIYHKEFSEYAPPKIIESDTKNLAVTIDVPAEVCERYMGVIIDDVQIMDSPLWIKRRLAYAGISPRNLIVDLTNYVMLDLGQPLHAFDTAMIQKNADDAYDVQVRFAKNSEKLTLLDGREVSLTEDDLVIASTKKPLALAGVMGGQGSAISEKTTSVMLEAATFDALHIRKTSGRFGLRTDASARFEKSLDAKMVSKALQRAVQLILELSPGAKVVSNVADIFQEIPRNNTLTVPYAYIVDRIGVEIERSQAIDTLTRLGFEVRESSEDFTLTIPSWRLTKDISIKEDIVEEIARMYGYDAITPYLPRMSCDPAPIDPLKQCMRDIEQIAAYSCGFSEVHAYSFVSPEWLNKLGIDTSDYIELDNPVQKDKPLVRKSIVPNLLRAMLVNVRERDEVRLFEIGRVYDAQNPGERAHPSKGDLLPRQNTVFGAVALQTNNTTPFYLLRDLVDTIVQRTGIEIVLRTASEVPAPYLHGTRTAYLMVHDQVVGHIGEIHPLYQPLLKTNTRVAVMELSLTDLVPHMKTQAHIYRPISNFPSVVRDMSIVVSRSVTHDMIVHTAQHASGLLHNITLFDVYMGEHMSADTKSLSYHVTYVAPDRTLTSEEVEAEHAAVLKALQATCNAVLRA